MTLKEKVTILAEKINTLDIHFTNHLSHHRADKILNGIYALAVIVMFCFLKWGR